MLATSPATIGQGIAVRVDVAKKPLAEGRGNGNGIVVVAGIHARPLALELRGELDAVMRPMVSHVLALWNDVAPEMRDA